MAQLVAENLANQLASATPGDERAAVARANAAALIASPPDPTDANAVAAARGALASCAAALSSSSAHGASTGATTASAAAIAANPELLDEAAQNNLNNLASSVLDQAATTGLDENTGKSLFNTIANVAAAPVPAPPPPAVGATPAEIAAAAAAAAEAAAQRQQALQNRIERCEMWDATRT